MIDIRLRSKISKEELDTKVGKILTDDDYNLLLTGPTFVRKPDGKPLCVYRPGALDPEMLAELYPILHKLKAVETKNRGLASGMRRSRTTARGGRTMTTRPISSAIIGGFDPMGPKQFCRLTAWTGREMDKFVELFPLFQAIAAEFAALVPDRYARQVAEAEKTHPDWVVKGTPFTTITVNNTYPTGVHTDKGDLDAGFSNLAVLRRGDYEGGRLVFPEYRVAADMHDGDLLLMDAHEWHGNTAMQLGSEDAERISIVCYFRTNMVKCDSLDDEVEKARKYADNRNEREAEATVAAETPAG